MGKTGEKHRFSMAVLMLAVMLLAERKSFRINGNELKTLGSLGLLFAASSITYYQSFRFMDAGIASTILFVYPVMVAVIMATFFREKVRALEPLTAVAIGVMVFGESLTFRLIIGIVLILSAVLLIVLGKNFHLRTITHTISAIVRKTWRWKS